MAGKIVASTINDDTGVLATQNGMTGIAKAWVNFDGTGTPSIRGSFNVSSITDNGTGDYTVNFTTAMPNANYCVTGFGAFNLTAGAVSMTIRGKAWNTTSVRVQTDYNNGTFSDFEYVNVGILSS
jgi:hypothetical protein